MAPVPHVRTTWTSATGGSATAVADLPVRTVSARQVADWFELVAAADRALADEMDWIGGCRAPVCWDTVVRLEALLHRLRDGARLRAELATLDPELLRAGGALWVRRARLARRSTPVPAAAVAAATSPRAGRTVGGSAATAAGDVVAADAQRPPRGDAAQGAAERAAAEPGTGP